MRRHPSVGFCEGCWTVRRARNIPKLVVLRFLHSAWEQCSGHSANSVEEGKVNHVDPDSYTSSLLFVTEKVRKEKVTERDKDVTTEEVSTQLYYSLSTFLHFKGYTDDDTIKFAVIIELTSTSVQRQKSEKINVKTFGVLLNFSV